MGVNLNKKSVIVPLELWDRVVAVAKKHSGLEKLTQTQVFQTILSIIEKK